MTHPTARLEDLPAGTAAPRREAELEQKLVDHIQKFLLELGQGFAFVGRQVHLELGDSDFYIDLLFYHLKLRCYVVIELKAGEFKPEYVGKMNFYLGLLDDQVKQTNENPSIGIVLCADKDHVEVEVALRDVNKPIGVADYQLQFPEKEIKELISNEIKKQKG